MLRLFSAIRSALFAYLVAMIMTIGAERMFWFWSPELEVHLEVAAYYSIATVVGIGLIRRFNVTSWWSMMLVAPVMGFIVEGVITPVIYTGGPMVPVFPAWFSFWHGIFAFAGLVFGIRRLLLHESMAALSAAAVGLGLFWALWSSTLWLPENVNDPELIEAEGGALHVLEPAEFGLYAALFTGVFIVAHLLLGFVWPAVGESRLGPSLARWEKVTMGIVAIAVISWTILIPWALPMFVLYCWLQLVGLRRHRAASSERGVEERPASVIDQLHGRVKPRTLAPLALMAPVAAGGYALLWSLDPSDQTLRVVMYGTIAVQGVIGFVVAVMALLRTRKVTSSSLASSTSRRVPSPSA